MRARRARLLLPPSLRRIAAKRLRGSVCRGPVTATWRNLVGARRVGSEPSAFGGFGMLLRRADAMLLLSVAQFSPPDLAAVLIRPNYSTSDAKLALANLLLWKSEIGDVVMPNQPRSSRAGLVPTGHLDAAQDDRLQDGDVNTIRGRIKEAVRKRPVEEVRTAGIAAKLSITSREDALVHAREVRRYCDQLHPNRPLSQPMAGLLYTAGGRTRRVGRRIRRIRRSRQPELVATRRAHAEESGVCAQIARRRAGGSGRCAELF